MTAIEIAIATIEVTDVPDRAVITVTVTIVGGTEAAGRKRPVRADLAMHIHQLVPCHQELPAATQECHIPCMVPTGGFRPWRRHLVKVWEDDRRQRRPGISCRGRPRKKLTICHRATGTVA